MNEWRYFCANGGTNLGKCEWVWEGKLRWLSPRWWNSRWLLSSSWVRMNEFELDWISLSQESEWSESVFEWIREKITRCLNPTWHNSRWLPSSSWVRMNEWRFFFCANGGNQSWQVWVSLRGKTKVAESKMAKFKMAEFKMAAIIMLSSMNEFESDWISLSQSFVQNDWIEDSRIQDGSHHQVIQIELVWFRVEWECFWVNLREDKKVSESKMAVSESNMVEFKMAAIIKLSQNEWVKVFLCKWWEPILASVSEFERKN